MINHKETRMVNDRRLTGIANDKFEYIRLNFTKYSNHEVAPLEWPT